MNSYRYPTRRVAYDVFHGDPFKIHSYSFRYADKPCYPPQQYQRPAPTPPPNRKPSFQTFFVNPKFGQGSELPPPNRGANTSRPRFLQEFQAALRPPLRTTASSVTRQPSVSVSPQLRSPSAVTDSPLLRTCCQLGEYQSLRTGQSIATLGSASSCSMRVSGGGTPRISGTTFCRSSNAQMPSTRDSEASSGCEININICSRESNSEADNNVSIRIGADACLLNNTDTVRPELQRIPQKSDDSLTASFGIDKRLSKFNVSETKPRTSPEWERQQREQAREQARQRERQFREELELERERELQTERERSRQRDREREQYRQQDRQRDLEHLRELEAVRERQRVEELRHREYHRMCMFQEQQYRQRMQPVQAVATRLPIVPPIPMPLPVVSMASHLYTVTSDERLPGMAFCDLSSARRERSKATRRRVRVKKGDPVVQESPTLCASCSAPVKTPISRNSIPSSPTPSCSAIPRAASPDQDSNPAPTLEKSTSSRSLLRSKIVPASPEILDCSSSFSSNDNVRVIEKSSGSLARGSPAQPLTETKQLNGRPPIVTRLNNIPIRITTSRHVDRNLDFSMNHVRVRGSSPVTRGSEGCHVNINLFPDKLRVMRI